jgi:cytosine/creatinine deaminase
MLLAHTGVVAAQLTGQDEIAETLEMVSTRAARVLGLGTGYGLEPGRPASLVVLPASSRTDAVRRQVAPRWVVAHGEVVAERQPSPVRLRWLGDEHDIDFVRDADAASATWRDARIHITEGPRP